MASESDQQHQQPKKQAGQASDSDHPPPGSHSPVAAAATGYPPAMGYPSAMGYPPGHHQPGYPPPNYHGYANVHQYNNYPYAQAPPATYYNHQSHHHQEAYQPRGFARGMFIGLILLLIFMCIGSVIMWIVIRPEIPSFQVDNFSVSNFNALPPNIFTANWDANVTVRNSNTKLKVFFYQIQSFVYYEDDELLASSFLQPFSMDIKTTEAMKAKFWANSTDQIIVETDVVDKLAKDRTTGTVRFSLRMVLWTTLKSGSWWTRHTTMRVYCEDLQVGFVGATGNGNLANGQVMDCTVFA